MIVRVRAPYDYAKLVRPWRGGDPMQPSTISQPGAALPPDCRPPVRPQIAVSRHATVVALHLVTELGRVEAGDNGLAHAAAQVGGGRVDRPVVPDLRCSGRGQLGR